MTLSHRLPVTRLGAAVVAIGLLSALIGLVFQWQEFLIVAVGCLLLVSLSALFTFGHLNLDIERRVDPDPISVGISATSRLICTNPTERRRRSVTIEDAIDGQGYVRKVQELHPGDQHDVSLELPTGRRAQLVLGPLRVVRTDPLGLFNRSRELLGETTVYVWPKQTPVRLDALGHARDLDGPTTDSSPAGSESFHTIREYQLGDDYRLVHWRSTAKNGFQTLLVRHFVDNRKPELIVALDTTTPFSDPGFELAVEIAASLLGSASHIGIPASLLIDGDHSRSGLSRQSLNLLSTVTPQQTDHVDQLRRMATYLRRGKQSSKSVIAIVGDVAAEVPVGRLSAIPVQSLDIIRITAATSQPTRVDLRTRLVDVDTPETFVSLWGQTTTA